jgi:hypothetical protein
MINLTLSIHDFQYFSSVGTKTSLDDPENF